MSFIDRTNLVDYLGAKPKYRGFVRLADATWWDIHGRRLSDDPEWNKWLLECYDRDNRRLRNGGCF